MPYKCIVRGCIGNSKNGPKVQVFGFPRDADLLEKWVEAIGREDFIPTNSSKVCELHFLPDDIRREACAVDEKTGKEVRAKLKVPQLNKGAVPTQQISSSGVVPRRRAQDDGTKVKRKAVTTALANRIMYGMPAQPPAVAAPLYNAQSLSVGAFSQDALRRTGGGSIEAPPVVAKEGYQVLKPGGMAIGASTGPRRGVELESEGTAAILPDLDWKDVVARKNLKIYPKTNAAVEEESGNRLAEDVVVSCRTCFGPSRSARKIFAEQEPGKLLYEIINDIYLLNIHPGDELAEYICDTCYQSVLRFQRFKKTSHEGHVALTSIKKKLSKDKMKSMENLCRLCVNQSNKYGNIFSHKHGGVYFCELINELCSLNVSVDDDLPAWVCLGCHNEVVEFSKCKRFAHRDTGNASKSEAKDPDEEEAEPSTVEEIKEEAYPSDEAEEDEEDYEDEELDEKDEPEDMGEEGISIDSFLETKLEEGGIKLELSGGEENEEHQEGEEEDEEEEEVEPPSESTDEPPLDHPSRKRSEKWGDKRFNCPHCEKTFALRHHLTIHIRTHTGEKPYRCKYCGKPFASHSGLSVHVRIHTGHKPHACDICGKRFTQSGTAREHAKIHSEERQHKCDKCGKAFAQKRTYLNHVKAHEKDTPVKCGECGSTLASMANWRKHHALVHLRRRPFKCDVCEKEFATSWAYRSHYRMHSGEKPYECKVCLMRFANPSGYKLHIRKH